ncbi:hypothetical protein GCM10010388_73810 [Streptomyces mauvecolor]
MVVGAEHDGKALPAAATSPALHQSSQILAQATRTVGGCGTLNADTGARSAGPSGPSGAPEPLAAVTVPP